ncbi:MAG: tetratricopeptide repeat protein [Sandaracinaceae bacterium]
MRLPALTLCLLLGSVGAASAQDVSAQDASAQDAAAQDAAARDVGGEASVTPEAAAGLTHQPDRESEARRHFFDGRNAWDAERYADALELWNRAYALSPRPVLLINIANAWLRLDHPVEAASAYRRFLTVAPHDAPERPEVETWVTALEGAAAPDLTVAAPPAPQFDPLAGRFWTWVTLGASAVTGALATGFYFDAESRFGAMAGGCGTTYAGCLQADIDAIDRGVVASQVLLGVALSALVTSVVLYFIEAP